MAGCLFHDYPRFTEKLAIAMMTTIWRRDDAAGAGLLDSGKVSVGRQYGQHFLSRTV